ncbi:class I SAM-dependent methyltransferase [Iamia sp.]|uniref:class I SAM-dependent methyltransferase n=1 Tax=Iamia sp. TaxID=2722710 RepID=UPI002CD4A9F2|nr:class I SAM-dependent methyltransferase [Iamia sp.]HXH58092.1 class I SAM-dependent methyltransferase [Iamia sp.]
MTPRRDVLLSGQFFTAVAGLAAMRRILTEPSAVLPRLDDVRRVVEHLNEFPNDIEIPVIEHEVDEGYTAWSETYDGPNPAIAAEEPIVAAMVAGAPRGRALDAGCGTGRHAAHLHALGYDVVGIDATHAMLERARAKVPGARFEQATLDDLPLADDTMDLTVCSLALTHVEDLGAAVAELARVTRPGGWVVVADMHPVTVLLGGTAGFTDVRAGALAHVRNRHHPLSAYVRAARAAGLEVVDCEEPVMDEAVTNHPAYGFVPDAVREAYTGMPLLVVWRFVRRG